MHQATTPPAPAPQRFDAGRVRISERDIARLMLCGEIYGAPYDLLAAYLGVRPDRLRGIAARWRSAGYADTDRLGARSRRAGGARRAAAQSLVSCRNESGHPGQSGGCGAGGGARSGWLFLLSALPSRCVVPGGRAVQGDVHRDRERAALVALKKSAPPERPARPARGDQRRGERAGAGPGLGAVAWHLYGYRRRQPGRPHGDRSRPGPPPPGAHGRVAFVQAAVARPGADTTWIPSVPGRRVGQPPAAGLQRGAAHRPPRAGLTQDGAGASRASTAMRRGAIRDSALRRAPARSPGATGSVTSR